MKKIDLGQSISIVANLGVIAGIVFLGLEIQQNTRVAQASSYQQSTAKLADVRTTVASDPELSRLFYLYLDGQVPDDLDGESRTRLQMLINNLFGAFEDAYFDREYKILGDSEWERMQLAACNNFRLTNRGELFNVLFISREFQDFLDTTC